MRPFDFDASAEWYAVRAELYRCSVPGYAQSIHQFVWAHYFTTRVFDPPYNCQDYLHDCLLTAMGRLPSLPWNLEGEELYLERKERLGEIRASNFAETVKLAKGMLDSHQLVVQGTLEATVRLVEVAQHFASALERQGGRLLEVPEPVSRLHNWHMLLEAWRPSNWLRQMARNSTTRPDF